MKDHDFQLLTAPHSAPVKMWTHGVPVEPEARELAARSCIVPKPFMTQQEAVNCHHN